jgi:hypothetical protein
MARRFALVAILSTLSAAAQAEITIDDFTTPQLTILPDDVSRSDFVSLGDGQSFLRVMEFGTRTDRANQIVGSFDVNADGRGLMVGSVNRLPPSSLPGGGSIPGELAFIVRYQLQASVANVDLSEAGVNDAVFFAFRRLESRVGSAMIGLAVGRFTTPRISVAQSSSPFVVAFPVNPLSLNSVSITSFFVNVPGSTDPSNLDPGVYFEIDRVWVGVIPEPNGAALLAAGAALAGLRRRGR